MKIRVATIILLVFLLLTETFAAASDVVTVTHPDGTVVKMSVEAYQMLYMNGSTDLGGDSATDVPWPTYKLTKYPLYQKQGSQTGQTNGGNPDDPFWDEYLQVLVDSSELIISQSAQTNTVNTANQLWGDFIQVDTNALDNSQITQLNTISPTQNKTTEERIMAYLGPSRYYAETAAYRRNGFASVYGLLIEGSYILVDMSYPSVGVRRTYFNLYAFQNTGNVPEMTLIPYPAMITQNVLPRYGPGAIYDPFKAASIDENTPITVFFEEDGYVFAEYEVGSELVRAWIIADSVSPR